MASFNGNQWLAVGAGAALGAWVRWGLSLALNASLLPLGTLVANLGGGLLMGIALAYFVAAPTQNELRLFVMTGFLGGLTPLENFMPLMQIPSTVKLTSFGSAFVTGNENFPFAEIPMQ